MELTHRFVDIHGIRTHYITAGDEASGSAARPTVVLLHGGGVDSAGLSWELLIPALAGDFRVIAPDLPGYGESDKPSLPYSVEFYAEFFSEFLDRLAIERAMLAGVSMGGAIALRFTLEYPQCVEKLALVDSYGLQRRAAYHRLSYLFVHTPGINELSWLLMRSRAMVRYTMQALLKKPGSLTPALLEKSYYEANRPGAGQAWNIFQKDEMTWKGTRSCFLDRLGEINSPTLIVHGRLDSLVPSDCATQAQAGIHGSELRWMEGCGHWPQRDDPETFNTVMLDFFKGQ